MDENGKQHRTTDDGCPYGKPKPSEKAGTKQDLDDLSRRCAKMLEAAELAVNNARACERVLTADSGRLQAVHAQAWHLQLCGWLTVSATLHRIAHTHVLAFFCQRSGGAAAGSEPFGPIVRGRVSREVLDFAGSRLRSAATDVSHRLWNHRCSLVQTSGLDGVHVDDAVKAMAPAAPEGSSDAPDVHSTSQARLMHLIVWLRQLTEKTVDSVCDDSEHLQPTPAHVPTLGRSASSFTKEARAGAGGAEA